MNINDWPYPEIDDKYKMGDYSWREVSERIFYDQLECLPPARMQGNAFAVGETWTHDEDGYRIHAVFCEVQDRYFCRNMRLANFDPELIIMEVESQFNFH